MSEAERKAELLTGLSEDVRALRQVLKDVEEKLVLLAGLASETTGAPLPAAMPLPSPAREPDPFPVPASMPAESLPAEPLSRAGSPVVTDFAPAATAAPAARATPSPSESDEGPRFDLTVTDLESLFGIGKKE